MPTTTTRRTSVGQACANAIQTWLEEQLDEDIVVFARWPDPSVERSGKVVSVLRRGNREFEPICGMELVNWSTPLAGATPANQAEWGITPAYFRQPMVIVIGATTDVDLDALIDLLDEALNKGFAPLLQQGLATAADDPVRAGLVLPFNPDDGYQGNFGADFEEVDFEPDPELMLQSDYVAIYRGETRGAFTRTAVAPILQKPTPVISGSLTPLSPPVQEAESRDD